MHLVFMKTETLYSVHCFVTCLFPHPFYPKHLFLACMGFSAVSLEMGHVQACCMVGPCFILLKSVLLDSFVFWFLIVT